MGRMSPINNMFERKGLNFNPKAQQYLLSVAVNKNNAAGGAVQIEEGGNAVEENKTNSIHVSNFKSNKLSHIDKKQRAEEVQKMKDLGLDNPGSPGRFEAIRMPNKVSKQSKEISGTTVTMNQQEI